MSDYCELHLHTHFSTLDGLNTPKEYMERAKELGMTHLSITDHGTLSGHRPFQKAAMEAGITPVLGVEAYISATDRFDRRILKSRDDGTQVYNHTILLARNDTGLRNLNKLSEIAWTEGFYSKPRIDKDILFEYSDGLTVLSGCMNGIISRHIEHGRTEEAFAEALAYRDALGENFLIEVQGHNDPRLNEGLLYIADRYGIRAVATSDCHYARKEDLWVEDAMLILSTGPKRARNADYKSSLKYRTIMERLNHLWPDRQMTFEQIEIYLRNRPTQRELFAKQGITREDIYDNTMAVAHSVEPVEYHDNLDLLPMPDGNPDQILREMVYEGLRAKGLDTKPEYVARADEELEIIAEKHGSPYFLAVADLIGFAKSKQIRVGPGRGSGAGSLVNYATGITNVDPIPHKLLFFRFYDRARDDAPDIDTDIMDSRRNEVREYAVKKYHNVANIATFTEFAGKNALKDAAKVLGVPLGDVNYALKDNDAPPKANYFDVFDETIKGKEFTKKYPEAVDLAKRLYGRIRQTGMHPAGLILSKEPISQYAPIQTATDPNDKNGPRTQYVALDMNQVADLGFIKLDMLGLKNLTIIDEALADIKARHGLDIDIDAVGYDDPNVYRMLEQGHTAAVFQAEGGTFSKWIKETKCDNFYDLVIGTSIARPGPLTTIGEIYKKRLHKDYFVENAKEREIVGDTKGLCVFQEQVMLYMTEMAGMSMSDANKVRKIIGKKQDSSEFEEYKAKFIEGCKSTIGVGRAKALWKDFEAFSGYAFNRSHAVAYSMLTYQTAWLKHYYPVEYMAAVLRNERESDSFTDYLIETKRLGIKIVLPHINRSEEKVSIQGDTIVMGLSNVKFVSSAAKAIVRNRPYASYREAMEKLDVKGSGVNKRVLGALKLVGAMAFPDNPLTGYERDHYYEYLKVPAFKIRNVSPIAEAKFRPLDEFSETGVFPILAMARSIKNGPGWSRVDFVDGTGSAGIFTTADTAIRSGQMYAVLVADNSIAKFITVEELSLGLHGNALYTWLHEQEHSVPEDMLRVLSFKTRETRAGKKMARVVVQDDTGALFNVMAFPDKYIAAYSNCREGALISAQVAETDDGSLFFAGFNKEKK